jgi:serine/threonine protein kinase
MICLLKEVDKRKFQSEELIAHTRMEIDILKTIQHSKNPNIIEFFGSQETENFFYMIFEVIIEDLI